MKKYDDLVTSIIENIGGKENIKSVRHCQTRLRFNLNNNDLVNSEIIEEHEGVLKVIDGDMYQIVIGTHVEDVYNELVSKIGYSEDDSAKDSAIENDNKPKKMDIVIDFISAVFTPIVPALAGSGMIKALLALLVSLSLISPENQTYQVLFFISDATFAFLPILIAFGTAKKLNTNQILAAVIAAALCHPTWNGFVSAGEEITVFGFIPLYLVGYSSSIFPVIFAVFVQKYLEQFLNKYIPKSINVVVVPMLILIIVGTLTFAILGPIGAMIGEVVVNIFLWLSEKVAWLELGIIGATWPLLTLTGMHHAVAPIGFTQLAQVGYDSIFGPAVLCSNMAMGISALTVAIISKNSKDKQIGVSAGVTSLMGISEPALYGVLIPKIYPLISACIGGAIGGIIAGLLHTRRFATGSSGLPAIFMYLGDDTVKYFFAIIISLIVTSIITAIMTFILHKRFVKR